MAYERWESIDINGSDMDVEDSNASDRAFQNSVSVDMTQLDLDGLCVDPQKSPVMREDISEDDFVHVTFEDIMNEADKPFHSPISVKEEKKSSFEAIKSALKAVSVEALARDCVICDPAGDNGNENPINDNAKDDPSCNKDNKDPTCDNGSNDLVSMYNNVNCHYDHDVYYEG